MKLLDQMAPLAGWQQPAQKLGRVAPLSALLHHQRAFFALGHTGEELHEDQPLGSGEGVIPAWTLRSLHQMARHGTVEHGRAQLKRGPRCGGSHLPLAKRSKLAVVVVGRLDASTYTTQH